MWRLTWVVALATIFYCGRTVEADAIKCYACTGTGDVCAKDKLEGDKANKLLTCPSGFDRCMTTWAKKNDVTAVAKLCASKAVCDAAKKACDDVTDGQCVASCCETDECNAGSAGLPTDGIKCYVCAGTENTCAKDKLEADKARYLKTCPSSMDRCMTTWAKQDGKTALVNSCASKSSCDTAKKACDDVTDGQCVASCCDTDECNAGSAGLPSSGQTIGPFVRSVLLLVLPSGLIAFYIY